MSDTHDKHRAHVKAHIGSPNLWHVVCDQCPWVQDSEGPWVDANEARRRAIAHATDPDIERKAADYASLWSKPNYVEPSDEDLTLPISSWVERHHEYARLRYEAKGSGEGQQLGHLAGRAHVRATQWIREQRRRENAILKERAQQERAQQNRAQGDKDNRGEL